MPGGGIYTMVKYTRKKTGHHLYNFNLHEANENKLKK